MSKVARLLVACAHRLPASEGIHMGHPFKLWQIRALCRLRLRDGMTSGLRRGFSSFFRLLPLACGLLLAEVHGVTAQLLAQTELTITKPPAERRVALVIGNAAYRHVGTLDNPKQDAEAIAVALAQASIELVGQRAQLDLDKRRLEHGIRGFRIRLERRSVRMVS